MSTRLLTILLCFGVPLAIAGPVGAQDEPSGAGPEASAAPAEAPATRPAPPPIMVVVTTTGRIADEVVAAVSQALVDRVTAMAGGRPVHALGAPELRAAIGACADDVCIGGQLAQAGAQAGVIARLHARGRRPLEVALELRDPVSGAPRLAAVTGELPLDPALIPEASAALVEPLRAAMPPPPPPPATLLVTVNVDGAQVRIDGQEIGTSPVAPVEVTVGNHEIVVLAPGYLSTRRQEAIEPGEQARVDVTLEAIASRGGGAVDPLSGAPEPAGGDLLGEWWFWTAIGAGAAVLIGILIGVGVAVADSNQAPLQPDPTGIMLPPLMGGF
jgi:hypothetical protein